MAHSTEKHRDPLSAPALLSVPCTYDGNGVTSVLAAASFWVCKQSCSCQDDPVEDPPGLVREHSSRTFRKFPDQHCDLSSSHHSSWSFAGQHREIFLNITDMWLRSEWSLFSSESWWSGETPSFGFYWNLRSFSLQFLVVLTRTQQCHFWYWLSLLWLLCPLNSF